VTCIVGYRQGSTVWLGGDGRASDPTYSNFSAPRCPKVWKQGNWVWGGLGSYRGIQLVRNYVKIKEPKKLTEKFLVCELVPTIKAVFENHMFQQKVNEQVSQESVFMLGGSGRLFTLWSDYSILEVSRDYEAIGMGAEAALGVFHVLTKNKKLAPKAVCKQALQIAAEYNSAIGPPYKIISTG